MIWTSAQRKKDFYETLEIIKHPEKMNPVNLELKRYIKIHFGINVLNVTIEKFSFFERPRQNSYLFGKKYILAIHVST